MSEDTISLQVEPRDVTGKAVKHMRRDGQVPAVIHDHGKPSINVQGDYNTMLKVYRQAGGHHPVELKAGDKSYLAIIKFATFEPRKNQLSHMVFNAVSADQKVEAEVPVHPRYDEGNDSSPAERNSLIVLTNLDSVLVEAIPSKLPDALEYDGEKLVNIGDHATVADLVVPAGVEIKTEPEHTIATVYEPSAVAAANDDAGGDAANDDAAEVESENGDAADDVPSQDAEMRPGGKKEAEDHQQATSPEKQ
jgi:large subunit ribosomal protein L25